MLVVVHHGDVEFGLEGVLDFETFRSLDVFQVDAAERGGDSLHNFDKLLRVLLVDFDVKDVDARVNLEQERLAFHHRLAREGANIAQPENRRAVRNHGDEVALAGVFVGQVVVLLDFEAGHSHARSVSEAQVRLGAVGLGGHNLDLAGFAHGMVFQRLFLQILAHLDSFPPDQPRGISIFGAKDRKIVLNCKDLGTKGEVSRTT